MKMRKTAWAVARLAASLLFISSLRAQAAAPAPDLASHDWSVNAKPNLTNKPPPNQTIQNFLLKLYASDPGVIEQYYAPLNSFAFADLRQSGTLSLVAALAPTSPEGCGETLIVDKVGEKFESAWIDCGGSPSQISGKTVVVVHEYITHPEGRMCIALLPVIYGWNGSAYVDMSKQFPGYYRQTLQDLQHEIASPASFISSYQMHHLSLDSASSPVGCDKIQADAIERFLGSPDAGIEEAIRWSQSSNVIDRMEAINMFETIRTPRALDYLKAMTSDSDPQVARAAEGNLNALNSRGSAEDPMEKLGHIKVYTGR
jgi:hypothetical protein